MQAGNLVMFSNAKSTYAKWFLGEFGIVESTNNGHCRVRWKRPIDYFDKKTTVSDFHQSNFTRI